MIDDRLYVGGCLIIGVAVGVALAAWKDATDAR
jgi:hypothetical protein